MASETHEWNENSDHIVLYMDIMGFNANGSIFRFNHHCFSWRHFLYALQTSKVK